MLEPKSGLESNSDKTYTSTIFSKKSSQLLCCYFCYQLQRYKSLVTVDDIIFLPKLSSSSKSVKEKIVEDLGLCSLAF
jgi:hypothetical protein